MVFETERVLKYDSKLSTKKLSIIFTPLIILLGLCLSYIKEHIHSKKK